jgi:hypothetical protein
MGSDELERGTGVLVGWRLTERGLGRGEGEWGVWGGGVSLRFY